jgi:hypothetical protein
MELLEPNKILQQICSATLRKLLNIIAVSSAGFFVNFVKNKLNPYNQRNPWLGTYERN